MSDINNHPLRKQNAGKRVTILGQGPGWEHCSYEGEVWTLNMGLMRAKRADKVFMMDPIERRTAVRQGFYMKDQEKIPCSIESVKEEIRSRGVEFVSAYAYPDLPTYRPYPVLEVIEAYGTDYLVNTICYMIAYALFTGVERIDLWGVNQASQSEFIFHKGCVEFWLGMAAGVGVEIAIHGERSQLLQNANGMLYGYRLPYAELVERLKAGEIQYKP